MSAESQEPEVYCGQCGTKLDERPNTPVEERKPCPNCGATRRRYAVTLSAVVEIGAALEAKVVVQPPTIIVQQGVDALISDERLKRVREVARRLVWYEPTQGATEWMVEVYGDDDALIDSGMGDSVEDVLLGVAERLLPPTEGEE